MGIISRMRRQAAVYWPPAAADKHGRPGFGAAVPVTVRWEDSNEEFIGPDGTKQVSSSVVYVGQDMLVGGWLWLGPMTAITDMLVPSNNATARPIQKFNKLPNFKATEHLRTAML